MDQAQNITDVIDTTRTISPSQKIIKKNHETVICDKCGFSYKKNNKTHHMKTKKHSEAISINKIKNDLNELKDLKTDLKGIGTILLNYSKN